MKSNIKKQETLSMKDALSGFKNLKVVDTKTSAKDWRNFIWNYPLGLKKLFRKTIPFSYVFCSLLAAGFFIFFLQSSYFSQFLKNISATRDTYTEGVVGAISSFNPLFVSTNYVDKTVESLVFQKFVYIDTNEKPVAGIAKSWTVSSDNLVYTFTINEDLKWQDGSNLTMDDVLFTFNTAVALATDYDSVGDALSGVQIVQIDDETIQFTLSETNPTFFEAVSLYIVPKSVLSNVALSDMTFSTFARSPMGSGKYVIDKTEQNAVYFVDNPYDKYNPHIKNIVLRIYPDYTSLENAMRVGNLDALDSWDVGALSFMSEYPSYGVLTKNEDYMDRIIFFNVRKDSLKDKNLRIGLSYLLNKDQLLKDSDLLGKVMQGPYSDNSWVFNSGIDYYSYNPASAVSYLSDAGYTKNSTTGYYESKDGKILSFTLSYLKSDLNDRLVGALVNLYNNEGVVIKPRSLEYNEFSQQVIATRDFEMLLCEVETTVDPDQYNLWHSLKVDYPNQNLSGYNYERVDILLEEARKTTDTATRKTKYLQFQKYLMADAPALFVYHPTFIMYFDSRLKGVDMSNINFSYERYWNIEDWYWAN